MSVLELIVLGIALAMDAFAVTISNTFVFKKLTRKRSVLMPLFFGAFQGLMPLIGYFVGSLVSSVISQYAGIITFVILGFLGGKMIWDTVHENDDENAQEQTFTVSIVFFQAIATSIDALAVGVSFAALSVNIVEASSIIALTTALCCVVALITGRRFGTMLGDRASMVGGIVLILIGLKSLFS